MGDLEQNSTVASDPHCHNPSPSRANHPVPRGEDRSGGGTKNLVTAGSEAPPWDQLSAGKKGTKQQEKRMHQKGGRKNKNGKIQKRHGQGKLT